MSEKNKIALIEFPQTASTVSQWHHYSELRDVVCVKDLENYRTKNGQIIADDVHCPELENPKYICAIVLLDCEGNVEQSQSPALGIRPHPEGGCIVCLTGFCLFSEDLNYYDQFDQQVCNKNPCVIAHELRCCLDQIALDKEDKAGFSFMETSMTFRRRDTDFIESRLAYYETQCRKLKTCGRDNGRRYGLRC